MSESEPRPERKVVLHPRTAAARQQGRRAAAGRVTRGFSSGPDDVAELVRSQLRLALRTLVILLTVLLGIPVLLIAVPSLAGVRVSDNLPPLHWLVTGVGFYLFLVVLGSYHERAANRTDRQWTQGREQS